jgi:replication-associated recombination protein RarA
MADKDFEVGYKKPPKATQFKPGQSGNPKGRPSGVKNLSTDLQEELESIIIVTENNQQREVTKQRAMIKSMFAKAMKGDVRASSTLLQLIIALEHTTQEKKQKQSLDQEDLAILETYRENLLSRLKQDDEGIDDE